MPENNIQVQIEVEEKMGIRPCIWQIEVVCKVLEGVDVMTIAVTGSGKSLCYWMVLLYVKYGIVFLVTPLKLLGKQFVETLERNDLHAMSMTAANATNELFEEIGKGTYQLVIVSPELLLNDDRFEGLWGKKRVM
ncbi:hypothetical protein L208DRAFT_1207242, partial [Tricholoma matsutake]